jgi:DNA processing protein
LLSLNWLHKTRHAAIITLKDPLYPKDLKEIFDPPPILYSQGDSSLLTSIQLAIVGSRDATSFGLEQATEFAVALADAGFTITSGMALGIDGASHKGALRAGGRTVAVLGCGVNVLYPRQHARLACEILERGCIVSEFPIGTPPLPQNFPRRNRIISGLSLGVLIVEAAAKSGSLITADHALNQGREVFAIPSSIKNSRAKGCHELIRKGAKLVDCITDIIEELTHLLPHDFRGRKATGINRVSKVTLTEAQQLLLNYIEQEPTCTDLIVDQTGLVTSEVGSILLELEIQGLIATVPGGYARVE